MPEIWIPYGDVEVSVDINTENLLGVIKNENKNIDIETIIKKIKKIKLNHTFIIILGDVSTQTISICKELLNIFKDEETIKKIQVYTIKNNKELQNSLLKLNKLNEIIYINNQVKKIIKEKIHSENIIFISEASFNPLFGFNGGPITLAKIINEQLISEAFYNQELFLPNSGNNKIGNIIEKEYQEYNNITSIELISENNENIAEIEIGKLNHTHNLMKEKLNNNIRNSEKKFQSGIFSCDKKYNSSLTRSLNGIWNTYTSFTEKSTITILSESSNGFGSEALQLFANNQLNMKDVIKEKRYIDGLENIIFLKNISENFIINIVSTLPNYYMEKKFKFRTFKKANDAVSSSIRRHGKSSQIVIIPHTSNILFK